VLEYTLYTPTRELEASVRAMSPIDGDGNGGGPAEKVFFDSQGANDFWVSGDLWSQGKATDAAAAKQISEAATMPYVSFECISLRVRSSGNRRGGMSPPLTRHAAAGPAGRRGASRRPLVCCRARWSCPR
jgi:hypothetical protein